MAVYRDGSTLPVSSVDAEAPDAGGLVTLNLAAGERIFVEVAGLDLGLGEICQLSSFTDGRTVLAEVCGFDSDRLLLMSLGELDDVVHIARSRRVDGMIVANTTLAAERAGLQPGDQILRIDGESVPDGVAFVERLQAAPG